MHAPTCVVYYAQSIAVTFWRKCVDPCSPRRIQDAIYGLHIGQSLCLQQLPALAVTAPAFSSLIDL